MKLVAGPEWLRTLNIILPVLVHNFKQGLILSLAETLL